MIFCSLFGVNLPKYSFGKVKTNIMPYLAEFFVPFLQPYFLFSWFILSKFLVTFCTCFSPHPSHFKAFFAPSKMSFLCLTASFHLLFDLHCQVPHKRPFYTLFKGLFFYSQQKSIAIFH